MGRLIDKDILIEAVDEIWQQYDAYTLPDEALIIGSRIHDCITEAPTAFDVDKVVEQLEAFRLSAQVEAINAQQHGNTAKNIAYTSAVTAIEFAIETVKGEQNGD